MHINGTAKQADDRICTPGMSQAVRSDSDLPARAWEAASTLLPAPHSPRHGRLSAVTTRPDQCGISHHHPLSRNCPSQSPGPRCYTSNIDLRQNHQNHDRCEADVEVSATHWGASVLETIRRIGGPSKCGRKRSSSTSPKIGSTRRSCMPTAPGHNRPKSTCIKSIRARPTDLARS